MKLFTTIILFVMALNAHMHVKSDESLIDHLIEIALSDTMDTKTRIDALDWLGHIGNENAIDVLITASYDENWDIRKQAIISLKFYKYDFVHDRIIELTQDSDPKNQIIAMETLYIAYQEGDLNILAQFLKHKDTKIRLLAAQSFWYIPESSFLDVLHHAYENEPDLEVKRKLNSAIYIREKK